MMAEMQRIANGVKTAQEEADKVATFLNVPTLVKVIETAKAQVAEGLSNPLVAAVPISSSHLMQRYKISVILNYSR